MAKYSPNAPCPCNSGKKYKKCCASFHKGAVAKDALILMKSRYSAYAVGDSKYIIKTTHPDNPDFNKDIKFWKDSIDSFCRENSFLSLKIFSFEDGDKEAYVEFEASLSSGTLREKSRFLKECGEWFYVDGVIDL